MPLEIYVKNKPTTIRTALKLMTTTSTMSQQAMPKTGELEDSLGGNGDGNTGEVEDSLGGEGDSNDINDAGLDNPKTGKVDYSCSGEGDGKNLTTPGRSKPKTGELEDSLDGDVGGNTGELEEEQDSLTLTRTLPGR